MVSTEIFKSPTGILKSVNLCLLFIALAIFLSKYGGWEQFVGTTVVSSFCYTLILLTTYVLGGMVIQKTFYETFMNIYFSVMLFTSSILAFVNGNSDGVAVSVGIFCLFSFFFFAVDVYFALQNAGAFGGVSTSTTTTATTTPGAPPSAVSPPTLNINTAAAFPSSVVNPSGTDNGPATIRPTTWNS